MTLVFDFIVCIFQILSCFDQIAQKTKNLPIFSRYVQIAMFTTILGIITFGLFTIYRYRSSIRNKYTYGHQLIPSPWETQSWIILSQSDRFAIWFGRNDSKIQNQMIENDSFSFILFSLNSSGNNSFTFAICWKAFKSNMSSIMWQIEFHVAYNDHNHNHEWEKILRRKIDYPHEIQYSIWKIRTSQKKIRAEFAKPFWLLFSIF